ncbi:hypothetical protein VFPPC_16240 [Pochonia chlamydosporia 170]|uniref:Uncharacterized protein n=1 Tax=Pochonia chlamydosporia 170 TaxID=1380566 RepID=A0A179FGL8_METCM|nr:hypothetical protein VFPPC_16240 [Pochonia chlamydosporia 170]OAQ64672.1 hypothetical protein VFPPC_16240 [Pochonia chlamydosporia 170]
MRGWIPNISSSVDYIMRRANICNMNVIVANWHLAIPRKNENGFCLSTGLHFGTQPDCIIVQDIRCLMNIRRSADNPESSKDELLARGVRSEELPIPGSGMYTPICDWQ